MKFFAYKLIVIVLSTTNLLIGMEEQETRLTIVGPITRQPSGTSTIIPIADSPSPTPSHANSTYQQTTPRFLHHLGSACPDTTQQCKCALIAAIIVLIVLTFVPVPRQI